MKLPTILKLAFIFCAFIHRGKPVYQCLITGGVLGYLFSEIIDRLEDDDEDEVEANPDQTSSPTDNTALIRSTLESACETATQPNEGATNTQIFDDARRDCLLCAAESTQAGCEGVAGANCVFSNGVCFLQIVAGGMVEQDG